ncbi:MAG: hypothetical protein LHW60_08175 [Candidatus Cloacimonetes bacterium]|jgi:signal transduction histidine kinase|nr:hypothetical protein [Candidatus Cloacimonadota bacterium]
MRDIIAAKHIIEGLIHNLNNPLNLVLGFAQKLKKSHPDNKEINIIYDAGIKMNKQLKELSSNLYARSFAISKTIKLGDWLDNETVFLENHLELKHSMRFERKDYAENLEIESSELALALWFEEKLQKMIRSGVRGRIRIGVCLFDELPSLYISPETGLDENLKEMLLQDCDSGLYLSAEQTIKSAWNPTINAVCGARL